MRFPANGSKATPLALLVAALLLGQRARADVAGGPAGGSGREDQVHGVLVPERSSPKPWAPRILLAVPRAGVTVLAAPIRGGLTIYERHHVRERLTDLFFNDARTFGVYPTLSYETVGGTGAGARLQHETLFGHGERLRLGAKYGGEARWAVDGSLGLRVTDAVHLRLRGDWQAQPAARFFGIGNADRAPAAPPEALLPARTPRAYETRYRQDIARAELELHLKMPGPFFAQLSSAYIRRRHRINPEDARAIGEAPARIDRRFDTATLPGWPGTDAVYGEVALGLDTLTAAGPFISRSTPSSGTKVTGFLGIARGTRDDVTGYARSGLDLLRYFDLRNGDRVLLLRAYVEGVAGATNAIPFSDLPRLGGPLLLRGYARDRFRDRLAVLGTIEYRYPVTDHVAGYLFVDVGRVLPGLKSLGPLAPSRLRAGTGGGLEVFGHERFLLRGQLAGSEEGVFVQLALEPAYRARSYAYRI